MAPIQLYEVMAHFHSDYLIGIVRLMCLGMNENTEQKNIIYN